MLNKTIITLAAVLTLGAASVAQAATAATPTTDTRNRSRRAWRVRVCRRTVVAQSPRRSATPTDIPPSP